MQTLSRHKSPRHFNKTWVERKTGITQRKNWKPACTYIALRWQKQLHNSLILVTSPELYSKCWQCLMKLPRSQMPQLGTLSLCFRWNWYSKWLSIINSLISLWVFLQRTEIFCWKGYSAKGNEEGCMTRIIILLEKESEKETANIVQRGENRK